MPTYEYECDACGHNFDEFQYFSESPLTKCPACKKSKLRRAFGTGAAILFKGSGFYETDYRSESYKSGAKAEKDATSKPAASDSTASPSASPAKTSASKPGKAGKTSTTASSD